jgi:isoquinoline 1-oxidoreductase subunit alpha
MTTTFSLNSKTVDCTSDGDTPLLWVLRDELAMTGTKFGCGTGQCGACTVHLDGAAVRSCLIPIASIAGKSVLTIEGLSAQGTATHPVQQAWIEHQVPQCGYCQSGQIMAVAALLAGNPNASTADLAQAVTNICRCGTYPRITQAVVDLVSKRATTVANRADQVKE